MATALPPAAVAAAATPAAAPPAGPVLAAPALRVIAGAEIVEGMTLGEGTTGRVVAATWLGVDIAVKWLKQEAARTPAAVAEFIEEARKQAALDHDGIIRVHGVVADNTTPGPDLRVGMVMERFGPRTLQQLLQARPLPPLHQLLRLLTQAARALEHLHAHGFSHGDIKPENMLVDAAGTRVKVADLGHARPLPSPADIAASLTVVTTAVGLMSACGSPPWKAPEQYGASPVRRNAKTDVYSFGISGWELLTGAEFYRTWPLLQRDLPDLGQHLRGDATHPPMRPDLAQLPLDTPPKVLALLPRCWATDAATRPTMAEVAVELEAALAFRERLTVALQVCALAGGGGDDDVLAADAGTWLANSGFTASRAFAPVVAAAASPDAPFAFTVAEAATARHIVVAWPEPTGSAPWFRDFKQLLDATVSDAASPAAKQAAAEAALRWLVRVVAPLSLLMARLREGWRVTLAGHGLGGAVAVTAMTQLAAAGDTASTAWLAGADPALSLVTFGAPLAGGVQQALIAGSTAAAVTAAELANASCHLLLGEDAVPLLPTMPHHAIEDIQRGISHPLIGAHWNSLAALLAAQPCTSLTSLVLGHYHVRSNADATRFADAVIDGASVQAESVSVLLPTSLTASATTGAGARHLLRAFAAVWPLQPATAGAAVPPQLPATSWAPRVTSSRASRVAVATEAGDETAVMVVLWGERLDAVREVRVTLRGAGAVVATLSERSGERLVACIPTGAAAAAAGAGAGAVPAAALAVGAHVTAEAVAMLATGAPDVALALTVDDDDRSPGSRLSAMAPEDLMLCACMLGLGRTLVAPGAAIATWQSAPLRDWLSPLLQRLPWLGTLADGRTHMVAIEEALAARFLAGIALSRTRLTPEQVKSLISAEPTPGKLAAALKDVVAKHAKAAGAAATEDDAQRADLLKPLLTPPAEAVGITAEIARGDITVGRKTLNLPVLVRDWETVTRACGNATLADASRTALLMSAYASCQLASLRLCRFKLDLRAVDDSVTAGETQAYTAATPGAVLFTALSFAYEAASNTRTSTDVRWLSAIGYSAAGLVAGILLYPALLAIGLPLGLFQTSKRLITAAIYNFERVTLLGDVYPDRIATLVRSLKLTHTSARRIGPVPRLYDAEVHLTRLAGDAIASQPPADTWERIASTFTATIAPLLRATGAETPNTQRAALELLLLVRAAYHMRGALADAAIITVQGRQNEGKSTLCSNVTGVPDVRGDRINTKFPNVLPLEAGTRDFKTHRLTLVDFPALDDSSRVFAALARCLMGVSAGSVLIIDVRSADTDLHADLLATLTYGAAPRRLLVALNRVNTLFDDRQRHHLESPVTAVRAEAAEAAAAAAGAAGTASRTAMFDFEDDDDSGGAAAAPAAAGAAAAAPAGSYPLDASAETMEGWVSAAVVAKTRTAAARDVADKVVSSTASLARQVPAGIVVEFHVVMAHMANLRDPSPRFRAMRDAMETDLKSADTQRRLTAALRGELLPRAAAPVPAPAAAATDSLMAPSGWLLADSWRVKSAAHVREWMAEVAREWRADPEVAALITASTPAAAPAVGGAGAGGAGAGGAGAGAGAGAI